MGVGRGLGRGVERGVGVDVGVGVSVRVRVRVGGGCGCVRDFAHRRCVVLSCDCCLHWLKDAENRVSLHLSSHAMPARTYLGVRGGKHRRRDGGSARLTDPGTDR